MRLDFSIWFTKRPPDGLLVGVQSFREPCGGQTDRVDSVIKLVQKDGMISADTVFHRLFAQFHHFSLCVRLAIDSQIDQFLKFGEATNQQVSFEFKMASLVFTCS